MRNLIGMAVAVVALVASTAQVAAQGVEFQIRTDKGGYVAGEAATVTVAGLSECSGQTVTAGMRSAARGTKFATAEVTLDASGSGSVLVPLMSDNGGAPIQGAVWANCVDRGFEPGLALDPHPMLISVSLLSDSEVAAFVPAGAGELARIVSRSDVAGILAALRPGEVIQTAYPGDGGPVARDVAATQLRGLLVPGSGSDMYGVGRLGLMGAWEINGSYALLASSIQPEGRHVVALGIGEVDGRWSITSYGPVVLSTGILERYALQHTVRLASIGPLAPGTGDTLASRQGGDTDANVAAGTALLLAAAVLWMVVRRPGSRI